MNPRPTISTLIPVGPGYEHAWLTMAMNSTLSQGGPFEHEVIIWFDGGTAWPPLPCKIADAPVIIAGTKENMGVANALNSAFAISTGQYIARLDADDFSLPGRYAAQLAVLTEHEEGSPNVDICGTSMRTDYFHVAAPFHCPSHGIVGEILKQGKVPCWHPTMMVRRHVYERLRYDPIHAHCEDYEWHCRANMAGFTHDNLEPSYVHYTTHPGQMSVLHRKEQLGGTKRVMEGFSRWHERSRS